MKDIIQLDKEYIADTYARFPITLVGGKGSLLYDNNNKEYIDFNSGIAVNALGISDGKWAEDISKQLLKLQHTSNLYYTEPCTLLAKELCDRTQMKKVFFSNSGAEANECAIKVARKYAFEAKGSEYSTIITLINSFHGRTITTLAATGQDAFHQDFLPLTQGFAYAKANDIDDLRKCISENKVAAIMFEVVQGEGGVLPLEQDFVNELAKIAKEEDILLICDEVQTGNGRTGKLYGYMNYEIKPDIVSTAKGLGGGLPIGATLLGERVEKTLTPGTHGSTFGGNPICCTAALSVLSRIDDKLLLEVRQKSEYIFNTLKNAKGIISVSGMGLMIGIETVRPASDIINECIEAGVLPIKAKNKIRLLPALNIPFDLLQKGIEILKEICAK